MLYFNLKIFKRLIYKTKIFNYKFMSWCGIIVNSSFTTETRKKLHYLWGYYK